MSLKKILQVCSDDTCHWRRLEIVSMSAFRVYSDHMCLRLNTDCGMRHVAASVIAFDWTHFLRINLPILCVQAIEHFLRVM